MCVYKPLARSYAIYYFFTTKFRSKAPDNKCDTMMIQCEAFLAAYSISYVVTCYFCNRKPVYSSRNGFHAWCKQANSRKKDDTATADEQVPIH